MICRLLAATLVILISGCASEPSSSMRCNPPPGAEALRADGIKYVVLGEVHGTAEAPALLSELACDAAAHGEHVLVAIETSASEQPGIDAFLAGGEAAAMISGSRFWEQGRDGRNSAAMVAMLVRVRDLRRAGLAIDVAAVDMPYDIAAADRDAAISRFELPAGVDRAQNNRDLYMAASVLNTTERIHANRVFFLVGNAHAGNRVFRSALFSPATGSVTPYQRLPMAAALPRLETLALVLTDSGGTVFNTTGQGAGVHPWPSSEPTLTSPGVALGPFGPDDQRQYDGRIFLGPISASRPASQ